MCFFLHRYVRLVRKQASELSDSDKFLLTSIFLSSAWTLGWLVALIVLYFTSGYINIKTIWYEPIVNQVVFDSERWRNIFARVDLQQYELSQIFRLCFIGGYSVLLVSLKDLLASKNQKMYYAFHNQKFLIKCYLHGVVITTAMIHFIETIIHLSFMVKNPEEFDGFYAIEYGCFTVARYFFTIVMAVNFSVIVLFYFNSRGFEELCCLCISCCVCLKQWKDEKRTKSHSMRHSDTQEDHLPLDEEETRSTFSTRLQGSTKEVEQTPTAERTTSVSSVKPVIADLNDEDEQDNILSEGSVSFRRTKVLL